MPYSKRGGKSVVGRNRVSLPRRRESAAPAGSARPVTSRFAGFGAPPPAGLQPTDGMPPRTPGANSSAWSTTGSSPRRAQIWLSCGSGWLTSRRRSRSMAAWLPVKFKARTYGRLVAPSPWAVHWSRRRSDAAGRLFTTGFGLEASAKARIRHQHHRTQTTRPGSWPRRRTPAAASVASTTWRHQQQFHG